MNPGSLRPLRPLPPLRPFRPAPFPSPAPAAAAVGVVIDAVLGDPPDRWHPTAWFGTAMRAVEHRAYADSVTRGAVHAAAGTTLGLIAGASAPAALVTAIATGATGLDRAARRIAEALVTDDLEAARERLPWLVGRDPSGLDTGQITRAAVESVAENCVDALVAPALWGATFGAPGVAVHRAVNTMDAMVGHRNERYLRYGRVSARLDDAMAWVPARVTAALVTVVRPHRARAIVRAVARDAPHHPSPNGGVAEAAFAAALGIRLGGTNRYGNRVEERPVLNGEGRPVEPTDIKAAIRLLRHVRAALVIALLGTASIGRQRRANLTPSSGDRP